MSCVNCGTGICGCGIANRANWNNQMAANQIQGRVQSQMGLCQLAQAQMGIHPFPPYDPDYEMFKKCAHMTDQEFTENYLDELKGIDNNLYDAIEALKKQAELKKGRLEQETWDWCAKYRKHMTKERLEKLKTFL